MKDEERRTEGEKMAVEGRKERKERAGKRKVKIEDRKREKKMLLGKMKKRREWTEK